MKTLALALTLLAFTLTAAAAGKKQNVTFSTPTTVAGVMLNVGDYKVVIDGGMATFFRDGKEVVQAPVQAAEAGHKFAQDEMVLGGADGHTLEQICFGGTSTRWVVGKSTVPAGIR